MQTHDDLQVARTQAGYILAQVCGVATRLGATVAKVLEARAAALGARLVYGELSRLSDAELVRRGMHRRDLHQHISAMFDQR